MPEIDETGVRRQNRMLPGIHVLEQLHGYTTMHGKCIDMSKSNAPFNSVYVI